uniref:Uncharacterized protein n=1 Tax=Clastoptera arizonana TaxID=38151 RepID=A0A1B6BZ82_9HEMI
MVFGKKNKFVRVWRQRLFRHLNDRKMTKTLKGRKSKKWTPPPNNTVDYSAVSDVSKLIELLKNNAACAHNKDRMEAPLYLSLDDKSVSDKLNFPWLSKFTQLCREAVGSKSIKLLENLLSVYLGNVADDVHQCYKKPKRAGILKTKIIDALKLFHMLYSDIKKPLEYTFYLDKMSDLLALYMDMEIKASRRSKETGRKISQRLTSSLYIFLDNSQDHILDSVLKAKFFTKRFNEICIPVIVRIVRDIPKRILYEMTYIRYLLVFKLWKKLVDKKEARIDINKLAISKLIPPFDFLDKLRSGQFSGVLPYVAKSEKDRITSFLMGVSFNVKEKAEVFLKASRDPKEGMLMVNPIADVEKSLFFSEDFMKCTSKPDPEADSTTLKLIDSIWASIGDNDDSESGECFRLCNELSLKPKKNKKPCKKEKSNKSKDFDNCTNDKSKKKKKLKDQSLKFLYDAKPKLKEGKSINMKEFNSKQRKQNNRPKIKSEKMFEEIEAIQILKSKINKAGQKEPSHLLSNTLEEIISNIKKEYNSKENSLNLESSLINNLQFSNFSDILLQSVKLDADKLCVGSSNVINKKNIEQSFNPLSILHSNPPLKNTENKTLNECSLNKNVDSPTDKLNFNSTYIDLTQPIIESDLTNKIIDLDAIVESPVIKTENIEENNPLIVETNNDHETDNIITSQNIKVDEEHLDVSKIVHEEEIRSDSIDACVAEHIQNERLDLLLENDISNYPASSELLHPSKDIPNDTQIPVSRDVCMSDQFSVNQPSSFFDGNEDVVVSQVLWNWPTHQVLLRSDINFGVLFPEAAIDYDVEDDDEEECNYQASGQYARGGKVAFGDIATGGENDTEWETQDQEYEESPLSSRDRSLSEASPAHPSMAVETIPQNIVVDQSLPVADEKCTKPEQTLESRTNNEINKGVDLSKFQQVSVNLKQVAFINPEKSLAKGMSKPEAGSLHDKTIDHDNLRILIQLKFQKNCIANNFSVDKSIPIFPPLFEINPQNNLPRCLCDICCSNYLALVTNYSNLIVYINLKLEIGANLKKIKSDELFKKN